MLNSQHPKIRLETRIPLLVKRMPQQKDLRVTLWNTL